MRIGELRNYIELQKYVTIKNTIGESNKLYVTYANCWAKISPVSAENREEGQKEIYDLSHIVKVRYNGCINQKDRIKFDNEYYEILEVINYDLRKHYQLIKAKKIES